MTDIADLVAKLDALAEHNRIYLAIPHEDWPNLRAIVVAAQAYVEADEKYWASIVPREMETGPHDSELWDARVATYNALVAAVRGEA